MKIIVAATALFFVALAVVTAVERVEQPTVGETKVETRADRRKRN